MTRIRTFSNGGTIGPGDYNLVAADVESSFGWRPIIWRSDTFNYDDDNLGSMVGTFYAFSILTPQASALGNVLTNLGFHSSVFSLDPSAFAGRRNRCRLRAVWMSNSVTVSGSVSMAMYGAQPSGGDVDQLSMKVTTSPIGGSSVSLAPLASSIVEATSGEFPMPQRSQYIFGFTGTCSITSGYRAFTQCILETKASDS